MTNKNLITPMINERLIGTWGAEMFEPEIGACEFRNGYVSVPGKIFPVKLAGKIGLRPIKLTFDFTGESPNETAQAISDMTDELQKGADILLPDGFYYWCVFDGAGEQKRKAPWIEQVKFQLHGVRHEKLEEVTLTGNGKIRARGNIETPMIVTLTPTSGATSMTFQGITISSSRPVTIDGFYTTVKNDIGNNVFGSTNMTEWPKLQPGENTITMTNVASAAVSYYPIWK